MCLDSEPTGDHDLIQDVLTEAEVLFDLDAARAEAWASGLLAEFDDEQALLDALDVAADERALAVATALTALRPAAGEVAERLTRAGLAATEFSRFVGTAVAVGAWSISDPYGDGTSVVVEYEHGDGVRHDVLVELEGAMAVDLLVSPPGVVDAARVESERPFRFEAIPVEHAYEQIRAALVITAASPDAPLTDAFWLNQALVAARIGLASQPVVAVATAHRQREPRSVDPEGDEFASSTLRASINFDEPMPVDQVRVAAAAVRAAWRDGDPDTVALVAEAGMDEAGMDEAAIEEAGLDADAELLIRLAGAYVASGPRVAMSAAAADAVDSLEWADWLGAVVQLVRAKPGADASAVQLVRNINRCPEVTTSIPKKDAPAVVSAFECVLPAWRVTAAVDDDDRLTVLGAWLLPQALAAAWRR